MAKTKSRRKESKQQSVSKPAKSNRIWIAIAAVLAIAVLTWFIASRFLVFDSQTRALLSSLSKLDLGGVEPQVATKIQNLREGVKKNPRSAASWGKLALNLDAHDFEKEAIPVYLEAQKLDSSDFRWPYFLAILYSDLAMEEAIDSFEKAAQANPDYVPLLVRQGDAMLQFHQVDGAVQMYKQALTLDPGSVHALLGLARIAFRRSELEESRNYLQKILKQNQSLDEANNLLFTVCRKLNDSECAMQSLKSAKLVNEKTLIPDPVYTELIAEGESSIWYRFRGSEHFKSGQYEAAIDQFGTALSLRPDAQSHEDLAKALSAAGKIPEAIEQYKSAIALHPTPENYFGLGLGMAKLQQYEGAEQNFSKAIQENPDFAEAYFNLAVLYAKGRRVQETITNLQHAIRIKPDYVEAHFYLAQVYLATRNEPGLSQELTILSKLDPATAERLQQLMKKQN